MIRKKDFISYKGRTQSVSGWANELNISVKRFLARIRESGIENAMEPRKRGRKCTTLVIEHNGERKTVKELASGLGISAQALRNRLAKLPVDIALAPKKPKEPTPGRVYEYDRHRNKAHYFGEPERLHNGKYFRTEHLEKYIRSAWAA